VCAMLPRQATTLSFSVFCLSEYEHQADRWGIHMFLRHSGGGIGQTYIEYPSQVTTFSTPHESS
jgi:hypothetical protein